jgi:hypothetical protein
MTIAANNANKENVFIIFSSLGQIDESFNVV